METIRHFASDNYSGVCPEVWEALASANVGHAPSYGDDQWTEKAADLIRQMFETDCEVFFVFNGTAANSLALASLCQSYHSILVHPIAHVETDECGAPEFFSNGTKVLLLSGTDGKIDPASIEPMVKRRLDIHYPKPKVLSTTQATEVGTIYSRQELSVIGETVRRLGLRWHMDGARFANAVGSLGVAPAEMTWKVGVDVLCLGATKNGAPVGDAVIFFNKELALEFDYRCKQAGQLASKMRFLAAPWVGLLQGNVWLRNASHANAMAAYLDSLISNISGIKRLFPCQANSVFVELPKTAIQSLHAKGWKFYTFIGEGGCRFMCTWDTQKGDVELLAADIRSVMGECVP